MPDGRVAYSLKKTWRDGSPHVVMEPQVLIERLLALVPRPRRHLVTCHGVLAPGASLRDWIVPRVAEDSQQEGFDAGCADPVDARVDEVGAGSVAPPLARVPHRSNQWRRVVRRYYTWAELCAVGASGGDLHVPKLRRSASAAGCDPRPGYDRACAAGDERALPRAPAAMGGAGVGVGAGSAGW